MPYMYTHSIHIPYVSNLYLRRQPQSPSPSSQNAVEKNYLKKKSGKKKIVDCICREQQVDGNVVLPGNVRDLVI